MKDPTRFDVKEILLEQVRTSDSYGEKRRVIKAYTIGVDEDTSPAVAGREKYVWVRESGMNGAVHQVFNPDAIPLLTNFPCLLSYSPRKPYKWEIYGTDWDAVYNFPGFSDQNFGLGTHARNHEWPDQSPGTDPLSVFPRAFAPLRTSAGSGISVRVWQYSYWYNDQVWFFSGVWSLSLVGLQPGVGFAVRVLVYLDKVTNTAKAVAGAEVGDSPIVSPPDPVIPNDAILSAFVRLDGSQTEFTEDDIADLRFHITETEQAGDVNSTVRVTTTYTILTFDEVVFCDTDGGAFVVTLPVGVEGQHIKIINVGSSGNALTVDGDGVETVWGNLTATLNDGDILNLHYNATEGWW